MNRYWNFLFGCLLVLGGCKGCEKETVKPTEKPVSASFKFFDHVGPDGSTIGDPSYRLIETDTFYLAKTGMYVPIRIIYIASDTSCDSYSWKVGDDLRTFTNRTSALYFGSPGIYPVRLIVTRTNKDGTIQKDSLTRSFRIIKTEYHPIIGKYIGYNVSKPDSLFKFFIGHGSSGTWPWVIDTLKQSSGYSGYIMTGLNGSKYSSHGLALSTKGAYGGDAIDIWPTFAGNYSLYDVFVMSNKSYDSVYVEYWKSLIPKVGENSGPRLKEKFIGRKYL